MKRTKQSITLSEQSFRSGLEVTVRSQVGVYATYQIKRPAEAIWLATSLLVWARRVQADKVNKRRSLRAVRES